MEDPNIVGALVGLTAPRQPGETIQSYDQCHAALERMCGSPTPAFFGQAGERSAHRKEQPVPFILPLKVESIKVNPLNPLPTKKPKRIPMAEKLEDRVAYQRMRNEDLSKNGGSHYDDQGIVFSTDGKVLDEMKQLYQSSIKATAAPGGDPGDDRDDESDELSDPNPYRGDPPLHKSNNGNGNSRHSGSKKGPARFDGGPPGYPDDGGNGSDGSDNELHHSHHSNGQGRHPNHNTNQHRGYSVPVAVHPRYNMPGVMEAVEHHRDHMHERLIHEHISVCLSIPDGMKLRQAEHSAVGKYDGSAKFGDLEKWLTDLVVVFEVSMYGGPDWDQE